MQETLFVKDKPTLEGFPADLLPPGVAQVLIDAHFRVVARMDERRLWLEYNGVEVGEGTPDRPDWGMESYSLMMEVGIFGMHLMKHILRANWLPYSGVVYSGQVPKSSHFMKELLAHCIWQDSFVTIDEEAIAGKIQAAVETLFDCEVEVVCNWQPIGRQVEIYAKHPAQPAITFSLADNTDVIKNGIGFICSSLSEWLPSDAQIV